MLHLTKRDGVLFISDISCGKSAKVRFKSLLLDERRIGHLMRLEVTIGQEV